MWRRAGNTAAPQRCAPRCAARKASRALSSTLRRRPAPDRPATALYTRLAQGVSEAGASRETLFLARLALLLCERLGDEAAAGAAIDAALKHLPEPSLSAANATY